MVDAMLKEKEITKTKVNDREQSNNQNIAFAIGKYIRISPSKLLIYIKSFKGKKVKNAVEILKNFSSKASLMLLKVLNSATSNAKHNLGLKFDNLVVNSVIINKGPSIKRMRPRNKGRSSTIVKRSSHITIFVQSVFESKKVKKVKVKE